MQPATSDGSTLYLFKGGKMAMEDTLGRATRMEQGVVMGKPRTAKS